MMIPEYPVMQLSLGEQNVTLEAGEPLVAVYENNTPDTKISISQLKEWGPDLRKRVESEAVIYVTKHGRTMFALVDCSYLAELEGAFNEG